MRQKFTSKKKIGQVLVDSGIISTDNLQEALGIQKKGDTSMLGEILLRLGYVSEENLNVALAMQHEHPFIKVRDYKIDQSCLDIVPSSLAKKFNLIPIERIAHVLTVAISDPANKEAVEELERTAKLKVRTIVACLKDIKEAIKCYYGG